MRFLFSSLLLFFFTHAAVAGEYTEPAPKGVLAVNQSVVVEQKFLSSGLEVSWDRGKQEFTLTNLGKDAVSFAVLSDYSQPCSGYDSPHQATLSNVSVLAGSDTTVSWIVDYFGRANTVKVPISNPNRQVLQVITQGSYDQYFPNDETIAECDAIIKEVQLGLTDRTLTDALATQFLDNLIQSESLADAAKKYGFSSIEQLVGPWFAAVNNHSFAGNDFLNSVRHGDYETASAQFGALFARVARENNALCDAYTGSKAVFCASLTDGVLRMAEDAANQKRSESGVSVTASVLLNGVEIYSKPFSIGSKLGDILFDEVFGGVNDAIDPAINFSAPLPVKPEFYHLHSNEIDPSSSKNTVVARGYELEKATAYYQVKTQDNTVKNMFMATIAKSVSDGMYLVSVPPVDYAVYGQPVEKLSKKMLFVTRDGLIGEDDIDLQAPLSDQWFSGAWMNHPGAATGSRSTHSRPVSTGQTTRLAILKNDELVWSSYDIKPHKSGIVYGLGLSYPTSFKDMQFYEPTLKQAMRPGRYTLAHLQGGKWVKDAPYFIEGGVVSASVCARGQAGANITGRMQSVDSEFSSTMTLTAGSPALDINIRLNPGECQSFSLLAYERVSVSFNVMFDTNIPTVEKGKPMPYHEMSYVDFNYRGIAGVQGRPRTVNNYKNWPGENMSRESLIKKAVIIQSFN